MRLVTVLAFLTWRLTLAHQVRHVDVAWQAGCGCMAGAQHTQPVEVLQVVADLQQQERHVRALQ